MTMPKPLRNVDIVEEAVQQTLFAVREIYPDAFLAGGYLRDRLAGVMPVDIDFFTFYPVAEGRENAMSTWGSADFGAVEARLTAVEQFNDVELDGGLTLGSHLPSQIIHIDPAYASAPWDVVRKFLFGAQQMFWMPDQIYGKTEEFLRDMQGRTFTVTRCEHELDVGAVVLKWDGTDKRLGLSHRFPGWRLLIPRKWWPQFEEKLDAGEEDGEFVTIYGSRKR